MDWSKAERDAILPFYAPTPDLPMWQWAAENVDFSLAPSYDTPLHGPYDPDFMPFWKQPMEWMTDDAVREVVVCKCSRAGGSENLLLMAMRHAIAVNPQPTLYVMGDKLSAETFMEERIKRSFPCCAEIMRQYRYLTKETAHNINLPQMDARVTWARNQQAFKASGWALMLADEVSTWPAFGPDMLRKRGDSYPFHHIAFLSSPDPKRRGNPEHDPIIVLYNDTDKQRWFMPDPDKRGEWFAYQGINHGTNAGLRWPDDARKSDSEWDWDRLRNETYYLTEHGSHVTEDMRVQLMREGEWRPTAKSKRDDVHGVKIVAPMVPFNKGGFGELAARFIEAKHHLRETVTRVDKETNPLRVYFAEHWGDAHREDEVIAAPNALAEREAEYKRGTLNLSLGKGSSYGVNMAVDVQKYHLWWNARLWERNGDNVVSSLIDYGTVPTFADLDLLAKDIEPNIIGIDDGYRLRSAEVEDYIAQYTPQDEPRDSRVFALVGSDQMKAAITDMNIKDAYEGRSRSKGSALYCLITWHVDAFRSWLVEMMNGLGKYGWNVPNDWEGGRSGKAYDAAMYVKQVASTKKVDSEWITPHHRQDHMFDCECMHLVLARFDGLIS